MKVVLSAKASNELLQLYEYLETAFFSETRRKFQKQFDNFVQAIKLLPNGFPLSQNFKGCRRCVVSKQTSIIYRVEVDTIQIVTILDNRKNL